MAKKNKQGKAYIKRNKTYNLPYTASYLKVFSNQMLHIFAKKYNYKKSHVNRVIDRNSISQTMNRNAREYLVGYTARKNAKSISKKTGQSYSSILRGKMTEKTRMIAESKISIHSWFKKIQVVRLDFYEGNFQEIKKQLGDFYSLFRSRLYRKNVSFGFPISVYDGQVKEITHRSAVYTVLSKNDFIQKYKIAMNVMDEKLTDQYEITILHEELFDSLLDKDISIPDIPYLLVYMR